MDTSALNIEIEKKYRLDKEQEARIRADLAEFDAEFLGEEFEENLIFGNERMFDLKTMVRLRTTENRKILTFKKHVSDEGGVKSHIEYESEVSDVEQVRKILEGLELFCGILYEKRRKSYSFRGISVVVDELSFGRYMEIEGTPIQIAEVELLLGADELEVEMFTYPQLTHALGKRNGRCMEARFENR
ncbi:MAG: CYTH domain-containing protein [Pyrinomonadaceae bacterium]